jgi:transposase
MNKKEHKVIELDITELTEIVEQAPISSEDRNKCIMAFDTLNFLTHELEKKRVSVARLKKMLFGDSTEKTDKLRDRNQDEDDRTTQEDETEESDNVSNSPANKKKKKGHGRNGAADYTGADKKTIPHKSLKNKDECPDCGKGRVYSYTPGILIRLRGQSPICGTIYEVEKFRCGLCNKVFSASVPESVGEEKYDASSGSMIAILKYGTGIPFYRLEKMQNSLGIPLPASTQWDIVEDVSRKIMPVYKELVHQGAQGDVLHNDDTTMKILGLDLEKKQDEESEKSSKRTGVFTSGIISVFDEHKIALFFTGRQHAGENIADVLEKRVQGLDPPIQMCDALSWNTPDNLKTIISNCLAHGRRRFIDVSESFPDKCLHVLEILKKVYRNDAHTRNERMTAQERLLYHQENSSPWMEKLKQWCEQQMDERKVEPNSGLGEAITYMLNHWKKLTLFLRIPKAPLDNNICERALKKAILNRKNAYFYKTENGAKVGDLFMSLIHTCELCDINPFDYLTTLQKYGTILATAPENWMPWNFKKNIVDVVHAN